MLFWTDLLSLALPRSPLLLVTMLARNLLRTARRAPVSSLAPSNTPSEAAPTHSRGKPRRAQSANGDIAPRTLAGRVTGSWMDCVGRLRRTGLCARQPGAVGGRRGLGGRQHPPAQARAGTACRTRLAGQYEWRKKALQGALGALDKLGGPARCRRRVVAAESRRSPSGGGIARSCGLGGPGPASQDRFETPR